MEMSRRRFIQKAAVAAIVLSKMGVAADRRNGIPYRKLGKTGEEVSLLTVGGQDGYRNKVLLMTKHHGRDPKTAQKHLEDSLRRFKTDVIDVWQFHEIDEFGEIVNIYSTGALDFALKAKKQGKIRYIGFTGHYRPYMHLEMINRGFDWDTVQMPINVLDHHFRSFTNEVLPVAVKKNIGVIGMKSLAGGAIVENNIAPPEECIRFAMTMPISTLCSGMDSMEVLLKNLATARNFKPMEEEEMKALLEKTAKYAAEGEYEEYKTYEIDEARDEQAR
jgi:predicted aldo/keto reductase-like oxidoreductase